MSYDHLELMINGFKVNAIFSKDTTNDIFIPLLKHLSEIKKTREGRVVAFIAAPPGVGKSTLCAYLEHLSNTTEGLTPIQSIGLDGFHHKGEYLRRHTLVIDGKETLLNDVKGCPETFDIERFMLYLHHIDDDSWRWPIYDRKLHDVVDEQILLSKDILIVEGNWLLLDEPKWRDCHTFADVSIFIEANEYDLKERLIKRKMSGGKSREAAEAFYSSSDQKNIHRVCHRRCMSDVTLVLKEDGVYHEKEKRYER